MTFMFMKIMTFIIFQREILRVTLLFFYEKVVSHGHGQKNEKRTKTELTDKSRISDPARYNTHISFVDCSEAEIKIKSNFEVIVS